MRLLSLFAAFSLVAALASWVASAQIRALARARVRVAQIADWHEARLTLQLVTMDFPEAAAAVEPALAHMNQNSPE